MSNCISFVGRIGKDSVFKTLEKSSVLEFTIACSVGYGERKSTMWFNCHMWGQHGEKLQGYIAKGKQVFVSGELSQREYTNKAGEKATSLELRVDHMDLIGSKDHDATETSTEAAPYKVPKTPDNDADAPF